MDTGEGFFFGYNETRSRYISVGVETMSVRKVSAPGRICLFGEHQDYLGLPVIAMAINLRIGLEASPQAHDLLHVTMPDTGEQIEIDPNLEQTYTHHRDYLRSAVNVLRREGLQWEQGYLCTMRGEIPINAGVSSSSAMVIMWLRFLLETATPRLSFTEEQLANWGYQTEVAEFGDPGGMMDHYCAALGGILKIKTQPPFSAERWSMPLSGFVLGHSLEPKATLETLGRNRRDVTEGMNAVKAQLPEFALATTPLERVEPYLSELAPDPARRLRANLINRDLTPRAEKAIQAGNAKELGSLLTAHHHQLRDGLDLSTPKIERMMNAALQAGALGGKINGSGGGGCMFAYAPGREQEVAEAIQREGGVPFIVRCDIGAKCE
jgi:galactokinase